MKNSISMVFVSLVLLFSLFSGIQLISADTITEATEPRSLHKTPFQIDQFDNQPMGVVIIDDLHDNDYTNGDMELVKSDLEEIGYITEFASDFESWDEAVNAANYLVISAPYTEIPPADIVSVKNWFEMGSNNLLLASRGDFEAINYDSINELLAQLQSDVSVQDDNVYTTDPNAYRDWYIETDNFDPDFSELYVDVEVLNFFSPSSIRYDNADVLLTAEDQAYQTNQNGDPATVIYDDTADGEGGISIPLGVLDRVTLGSDEDRIIALGTTMWSDFDYGDTFADDINFFHNLLEFLRDETLAITGEIVLNIEDTNPPSVEIAFPHENAILSGTVELVVEANDPFGVVSREIKINDTAVSGQTTFLWDTTTYSDGTYVVTALATDEAGNIGTDAVTYTIDQDHVPELDNEPKIMTYNILQSGVLDAWFEVMVEENADIAVLVETGDFDDNNNAKLKQVTADLNAIFFDEIEYNAYTLQDIDNTFNGIAILSRFELISNEKLFSLETDDGNTYAIPLPFLHSVVNINGQEVNFIGGHLTCCPGQSNWIERKTQQEAIINYMDDLGEVPVIYLGDMNAVSPQDVDPASQDMDNDLGTEPITMIVDASHPKSSKIHTFVDVHSYLNPDTVVNTYIGSVLSRIDYIFVNQFFADRLISSTTGDTESAPRGSDHLPVDVVIDVSTPLTPSEFDTTFRLDTEQNPISWTIPLAFLVLMPVFYRRRRG